MLDKNQWLAIGLLSGFAYILGKDRESFEAEQSFNAEYQVRNRPRKKYERNYKYWVDGTGKIIRNEAFINPNDRDDTEIIIVLVKEGNEYKVGEFYDGRFWDKKTFATQNEAIEYFNLSVKRSKCKHENGFKLSDPIETFYDSHERFSFYCCDCGISAMGDIEPNFRYLGEDNDDSYLFEVESFSAEGKGNKQENSNHRESFEAEKDNHYYECYFEMFDSNGKSIDSYVWSSPSDLSYSKATELAQIFAKKVAKKGVEPYWPKPNRKVSKIKFTSFKKISADYKKSKKYSPEKYPSDISLDSESFDAKEMRREWTFLWKPKNEGWGNSVYAKNLNGAKEQILKTYSKGSSFFQRADLSTLTDDPFVNKQRWRNWDSQWNAESFEAEYTLKQMAEKSFKEIDKISGFVADRLNHTQESWSKLPITKRKKILRKIRKDEDGWFDLYSLDAESFEAENLMKGQMENIYLVALGMAHQEILNGGERATMEIWFEGRPVMLAIDNAAGYFAINPKVLQSRYDSHNFVEPDWRDEYHQALSALKESFPTWSMFSPKLEKRFDL